MLVIFISKQKQTTHKRTKKTEQRRPLHGKTSSPLAPPLTCPKNHHKKLDNKRNKLDKNGTFILQHCPVNHIVAKGHTFFSSKGKIDKNGTSSKSDKGHTFFPSKAILKPKRKKIEQRRPFHGKAL